MSRFPEVALVALLLTTFVSACGPTEDDPSTREPTATKLRLINESGGAIWYEEPGTCAQFAWLTLHDEGTEIATEYDACRFGARCSDITNETCSRVQCAPCLTDVEPKKLEAGERLTIDWAGWVWRESSRQNDCSCGERIAPKAETQFEAEFCWWTEKPSYDRSSDTVVPERSCTTTTFRYGARRNVNFKVQ